MPEKKNTERVTVKCIFCGRTIDGHFFGRRDRIVNLGSGEVLAEAGTYQKKKGFIHSSCKTGIDAVDALEKGGTSA